MVQDRTLDVQRFIDENKFSGFQWLIFALCFLIVLLDGFDTAAIGYIAPSLIKEWGIAKPDLAPVLSAALMGLLLGGITSGPLADRFGRKLVLVSSVTLFAAACLVSSFAPNLDSLVVWRFITGLGLGAAMPGAVTMTSEFVPSRRRAILTSAMFTGFPLGAALGGFLAAWVIPQWGWRAVLLIGGVAPLCLAVVLLLLLPESVRYMVARGHAAERIRAVLCRIAALPGEVVAFATGEVGHARNAAVQGKAGIAVVLSRSYIVGSVMLWLAYGMGIVIFYSLINWMPILFKDAGIDPKTAVLIASLFPLGGVGAIALGWLMDRFNPNRMIMFGFLVTAVFIYLIGQAAGSVTMLVLVVFLGGAAMNTSQTSLPALAAAFYPTSGRATGVAWMMAVGRIGAVIGPFLVAELQRRQMSFEQIFMVLAVPAFISAAALLVKNISHPEGKGQDNPAAPPPAKGGLDSSSVKQAAVS